MPTKTRKKAGHIRRGGGIIGKGTYGCVYRPSLKCSRTSTARNDYISKLLSHEEAAKEFSYSKILKGIDPDQKYFLYSNRGCRFDIDIQNDSIKQQVWGNIQQYNIKKRRCPAIDIIIPEERRINANVLQMPYGGLQPVSLKIDAGDYLGFFKSIGGLLNGIRLLHRTGHVHHDIKLQNILVQKIGDGEFQTRIIDFGLMNKIEKINGLFNNGDPDQMDVHKHYTTPYPIWPMMTFALYENLNLYSMMSDEEKKNLYKVVIKKWSDESNKYYQNYIPSQICYDFSFENGQIKPHYMYNIDQFNNIYQNLFDLGNIENFIKYIDIYSTIIAITYIFSYYFNFRVGPDWDQSNATNPIVHIADFTSDNFIEYNQYNWTADQGSLKSWLEDFIKYVADPFYIFAIIICRITKYDQPIIIDKLIHYYESYFLYNMKLLLYDEAANLRPEFIQYLVIFRNFSIAAPTGGPYSTPTGLRIMNFEDQNQFNIFQEIPAIKRNNTKKQSRNNGQQQNRNAKKPTL